MHVVIHLVTATIGTVTSLYCMTYLSVLWFGATAAAEQQEGREEL